MIGIRATRLRLRLDPEAYRQLCREVLERDGWRCQSCGRMEDLQVHHIQWRSRLGNDEKENLITLCSDCHQSCHGATTHRVHGNSGTSSTKQPGKMLRYKLLVSAE
jgi:5-methylcytosine-specific restriction endonuclease McrA